ncbi:hypothetical protein [Archangium sp.]|uniref:hypothetical protein n=1 Tax=Archangium sp. TaxID=1872627 RepID=UPI003899B075
MRAVRYVVLSSLLAAVGCGGMEQSQDEQTQDSVDVQPAGKGGGIASEFVSTAAKPGGQAAPGANGITNHGGPVMTGTNTVYFIYYGNWSGNTAPTIIGDWANSIGGSPYFNINTTYTNTAGTKVSNSVVNGGSTTVAYPYGTALTDANIQSIVADAINGGKLPKNTSAVYFVVTSSDVNATSGFCTQYCGWHTHGTIGGSDIKYSFVGNPDRCPSSCEMYPNAGPNGNPGADGMISILSHELEEAVTDPDLNAWYDTKGAENADKCAWTFGTTYAAANGATANMKLGTRDFLIQQNWVNASGGYCAKSF